jgi:hypothetical protein
MRWHSAAESRFRAPKARTVPAWHGSNLLARHAPEQTDAALFAIIDDTGTQADRALFDGLERFFAVSYGAVRGTGGDGSGLV